MRKFFKIISAAIVASLAFTATANAGPVFLTGHDPDFHSQPGAGSPGAGVLLAAALSYVTGGTYNSGPANKFLWVEATPTDLGGIPSGHLYGVNGLLSIGLVQGVNFDAVDAAGLAGVNFSNYRAIAVASTFGGMLTARELTALIALSPNIATFVNGGGGLFASAECFPCGAGLAGSAANLFGFVPVTVTSIGANGPFNATPFGLGLGLTNADLNDPTHNSFGLVGGLNIVDIDNNGNATTLAGNVNINGGGFVPVTGIPEPGTLAILGAGLLGLGRIRRRKAKA